MDGDEPKIYLLNNRGSRGDTVVGAFESEQLSGFWLQI
jgi:hypothetical protein